MRGSRGKLPTSRAIRKHWAKSICALGKFDSEKECLEADYCFACGWESNTERAHIKARCRGGSDLVQNLHNLCNSCHVDSESLEGKKYWAWFRQRSGYDGVLSMAFKNGLNPSGLIPW